MRTSIGSTDAILITGAGRRIGLHLAQRMMERGRSIIAHYHHWNDDIAQLQRCGALCIAADLTKVVDVDQLISLVSKNTSSLRAIIHNASSFEEILPNTSETLVQFDAFYAIHMRAPFQINQALSELLIRCTEKRSDIIHITDIYADRPNPKFSTYCATKAGLQNLGLSFAKSLAPKVKVNILQPGPILFKEWHEAQTKARILEETPLGEEGGVEAIGLAVEAILANDYQTGAVIAVDGGRRLA